MDTVCTWKEKVLFSASFGEHTVPMDTKGPIGTDRAASPKQLVLAAICGCSGMDVASLLRKAKQTPTSFTIAAHADLNEGHPSTFKQVRLLYKLEGDLGPDVILDAVKKSMTLYCSVSAMISKSCPIAYEVEHNGTKIGAGEANFPR